MFFKKNNFIYQKTIKIINKQQPHQQHVQFINIFHKIKQNNKYELIICIEFKILGDLRCIFLIEGDLM